MRNIVILVGRSCSGKTTLARYLEGYCGFERIRTATTRPRRINEQPDSYLFLSERIFDYFEKEGAFLEVASYPAGDPPWKYGSFKEDYIFSEDGRQEDRVVVLTPNGVYEALDIPGMEKALVVWIDPPEEVCLERASLRGDSFSEIRRRLETDRETFEQYEHSCLYDIIFHQNETTEYMAEAIAKELEKRNAEQ